MKARSNAESEPLLFKLPPELFQQIINLLTTQEDLIRFSQTHTKLRANPMLLEKAYSEVTNRHDLPTSQVDRYMATYGSETSTPAWKEFCRTHKSRFELRFKTINAQTGPYVNRMAMYEWASSARLLELATFCPNLHDVDFTGISEAIDTGIHINNEVSTSVCRPHRFKWSEMLKLCPFFFTPLQSAKVNYQGCTSHPVPQNEGLLPLFLRTAYQLERLEIYHSVVDPDRREGRNRSPEISTLPASISLQHAILHNAGKKLHTLSFSQAYGLIRNFAKFLKPFTALKALKVIETSVYHDLMLAEESWHPGWADYWDLDSITQSPLHYIIRAKEASDYGGWKLLTTDKGDDCPSNPAKYVNLAKPENLKHLLWLRHNFDWDPLFDWGCFDWECKFVDDADGQDVPMYPPSQERQLAVVRVRYLFKQMKDIHMPVRLLLRTPEPSRNILRVERGDELLDSDSNLDRFWYHSASYDVVQRYSALAKNFPLSYARKLYRDTLRAMTISRKLRTTRPQVLSFREDEDEDEEDEEDGEDEEDEEDDPYQISISNLATYWGLSKVGDLVDELRLIWNHDYGFHKDLDRLWGELDRLSERNNHVLRVSRKVTLRRLKSEANWVAPLFQHLAIDFPNLARLALYIPAALYPDTDELFISHVLPGHGWTVQHSGSGGGDTAPRPPPTDHNAWKHAATEPDDPLRLKIAEDRLEREALIEFHHQRCPRVHRVFTRTSTAAADRPPFNGEVHTTTRPAIDLQNPDILQLTDACTFR